MAAGCVVFVHIPKTAGTTLGSVLRRQYRPENTIHFSSLEGPLHDFGDLPYEERAAARLVWGHLHFGIDRWLPQPAEYVTVLRNPVARVLSLFGYILNEPKHPLHQVVVSSAMTLTEFVERGIDSKQLENGQTRQLSGLQDDDPGPDHLDLAIDNLRRCVVVGTTEQFDESVILMKRAFGWRTPIYLSRNVSPALRFATCSSALAMIEEKNELDVVLYAEAQRLFRESIRRQDPSLSREVRRLRQLNRIAGRVAPRAGQWMGRNPHGLRQPPGSTK